MKNRRFRKSIIFFALSFLGHMVFTSMLYYPDTPAQVRHASVVHLSQVIEVNMTAPYELNSNTAVALNAKRKNLNLLKFSQQPSIVNSEVVSDVLMHPVIEVRELPEKQEKLIPVLGQDPLQEFDGFYKRISELDRRARAQKELSASYPQKMYDARLQGKVILEILIGAEGHVDDLRIIDATEGFAKSALQALQGMIFLPAEALGQKVASRMVIEMNYLLLHPSLGLVDTDKIMQIEVFDDEIAN